MPETHRRPAGVKERAIGIGRATEWPSGTTIVASEQPADVIASPGALPFPDGTFTRAALRISEGEAEPALREVVRVTEPAGGIVVEPDPDTRSSDATVIEETARRVGLDLTWETTRDSWRAVGVRESGVSPETWRTLERGSAATAWNDEMFEFQRTPYDPRTVAGWIFLRRVHWVARRISESNAKSVLEVGCEAGGLLRHLPRERRIVGVDLSLSALRTARRELVGLPVTLVHADATRPLPFRDGEFDAVIASKVLEHCRSPRRIVGEIHRVLADGGRAIFTVPNERRYLAWKQWLRRLPLTRWILSGIEEGPAAWHIDHDFDRDKLLWLVDGFFTVEKESSILGTTLAFVLRKAGEPTRG